VPPELNEIFDSLWSGGEDGKDRASLPGPLGQICQSWESTQYREGLHPSVLRPRPSKLRGTHGNTRPQTICFGRQTARLHNFSGPSYGALRWRSKARLDPEVMKNVVGNLFKHRGALFRPKTHHLMYIRVNPCRRRAVKTSSFSRRHGSVTVFTARNFTARVQALNIVPHTGHASQSPILKTVACCLKLKPKSSPGNTRATQKLHKQIQVQLPHSKSEREQDCCTASFS
jgi:hypothetical protein